jgi:hypothetical protein
MFRTNMALVAGLAELARYLDSIPVEVPTKGHGIEKQIVEPKQLGAHQTRYAPNPCGPPKCGSKRKRQWR